MNKYLRLFFFVLFSAIVSNIGPAVAQTEEQVAKEKIAREQFLLIENLSRLPVEEQRQKVTDFYPYFMQIEMPRGRICVSICYERAPLTVEQTKLPPEEIADIITKRLGGNFLAVEAKYRGRALLHSHRDLIKPLIEADLRDDQTSRKQRGLQALKEMGMGQIGEITAEFSTTKGAFSPWLSSFFDEVKRIFQSEPTLREEAAQTFRYLSDPRAIQLLIEQDPVRPTRFYEILGSLAPRAAPHPVLLALLNSPDATTRWQTLWALSGADKETLLPFLQQLLHDADPKVRQTAISPAFGSLEKFRPVLLSMLNDSDVNVRYTVAFEFCFFKKDKVALPTTLELLKDNRCNNSMRWQAIDWVRQLTGKDFGFDGNALDDETWRQPNERNRTALLKFEQWLKENPVS